MKKIIAILGLVLLCLGAAVGGIILAIGPDAALKKAGLREDTPVAEASEAAADEKGHETAEKGDAEKGHGDDKDGYGDSADKQGDMPVMPFPEIIVNVTDTSVSGAQTSRFLKLNMLMVYDDTREGAERLVAREIFLRDSFQDFLRQLHVSDLQGSHGLAMLKTELLRRARAVGHTDAPVEILVADMVVQ